MVCQSQTRGAGAESLSVSIPIVVTAAASVPFSSTSTKVFCFTKLTNIEASEIPDRFASAGIECIEHTHALQLVIQVLLVREFDTSACILSVHRTLPGHQDAEVIVFHFSAVNDAVKSVSVPSGTITTIVKLVQPYGISIAL